MQDQIDTVPDCDTTSRTKGTRVADLKARALAAFFAPEEIRFLPKNVKDGRALALAYLTARAVQDRLDTVLGVDCWQDEYETLPNGTVRCRLLVRFDPAGEWITKTDVGGPSEQPDESDRDKAAHSDALKRAAVKFGVGRYLYLMPKIWAPYDMRAKEFAPAPAIPVTMVPTAYRPAPRERCEKVSGLLRACLEKAKVPQADHLKAAANLLADYGYNAKQAYQIQNRHADAMIKRLGDWTAEIAKDNADCPLSPLYSKGPKSAPAPAAVEKKEDPKKPDPAKCPPGKPVNGAELWARIEIKDRELAEAGRIKRDALKAHVIAEGVKRAYSADVTRWQGVAIDFAVALASEFIKALPARDPDADREPDDAPGYAVA